MIRLGVTGTDTNVGKTVITAALTAWMRAEEMNVVAIKPIETGGATSDAEILFEAGDRTATLDETCPFRFPDPVAPLVAARRAGRTVTAGELDAALKAISNGRDGVIVEGAGGMMVPISAEMSYSTLFKRWNVDLVIVAANRLGVINHALLTVGAARTAGIPISALVLNDVPGVPLEDVSRTSNRDIIEELIGDIPVLSFPTLRDTRDISLLTSAAKTTGLGKLILERCRR